MSTAEAIKALAESLGVWRPRCNIGETCIWTHGDDVRERTGKVYGGSFEGDTFDLTSSEALLWLHLYVLPVDRETCPDCEGMCGLVEHEQESLDDDRVWDPAPWPAREDLRQDVVGGAMCISEPVPCPTCKGPDVVCQTCGGRGDVPGRPADWENPMGYPPEMCEDCGGEGSHPGQPRGYVEVRRWARHFLGSMPRVVGPDEFDTVPWPEWSIVSATGEGDARRWVLVRSLDDRDALAVKADELQADGNPLGDWLSMWLADAPCPTCNGSTHAIDEGPFGDPALAARARRDNLRFVFVWPERSDVSVLLGGCPYCRVPDDRRLARPSSGLALDGHAEAMNESARRLIGELRSRDPEIRRRIVAKTWAEYR